MKSRLWIKILTVMCFFGFCFSLASCGDQPQVPRLSLTSVDGTAIEIDDRLPLTALFFFSASNPVALGVLDRLPEELDESVDTVAIAMHVDRPPNITIVQQRTLIPIVIDEANRISEAFDNINLTPSLILVDKGKIHLQQHGRINFDEINEVIQKLQ